jgi:hypothetical protein
MTTAINQRVTQYTAFLEKLIEKRRKLIDALDANKGEINLDIFEDFYPDRAHFVYELLQNAEDAGATEVTFTLTNDHLVCEHDGHRRFTEADVAAITGIHNSTKADTQDRIGKFGVGFKSVFVYTQSPTVRSGDFAFRIVKLILPEPIDPDPSLGVRTRFEFPFDNPSKPTEEAYAEIAVGLRELDETTLLFLSNLQSIRWHIGKEELGEVVRHKHSESHFEMTKRQSYQSASSCHFLKFDQPVPGLLNQRIAVAFRLDFLTGVRKFDAKKPLSKQLKIVPATPGRVAVFFIAAKETSGLQFHLHGPFVPELSRASIKETAANEPLFEQLAKLCAQSLHKIRDIGFLTPGFLEILPNPQDQIPVRYQAIRSAIIAEMQIEPLTPTHARGHAAASRLVQARASLKDLLSEADLEFLVEYKKEPPLWAAAATQKNSRIDNFLDGLEIREWGIGEFGKTLQEKADTNGRYINVAPYWLSEPDEDFMAWLASKSVDWLQQLYALLHDEAMQSGLASRLKSLKIVRLGSGSGGFETASRSFFPSVGMSNRLPTVATEVYTSGKSKPQQEKAKKFLSDLGVREPGDTEEVELLLKERYTQEAEVPDDETYGRDLERFITLVERKPETKTLFANYFIFHGDDEQWHTPPGIYLDSPYLETDLSAYYGRLGERASSVQLHELYETGKVSAERIGKFAHAVGARVQLEVTLRGCRHNPQWDHLKSVGGDRDTSPINRDYFIPGLSEFLAAPSLELSRLIWRTLVHLNSSYLRATYQHNQRWGAHSADSSFVHELRSAKWVPQGNGEFVLPADASRELLPEGFPFDAAYKGLKAIQFSAEVDRRSAHQSEKDSVAEMAGFANAGALERARRFASLPEQEQERFLADRESAAKAALPDRDPVNPERRARNITEQAKDAPDKESEIRSRSVSVGREDVKIEAEQYLRQHYRNADGEMTCQICKGPLPFKLDDGSEFFETVEFLPGLSKRHFQNYLALCPNHSAMYRHANGSREIIHDMVENLGGSVLEVILAQKDMTIYLSTIHVLDLKAVLESEVKLPPQVERESSENSA